MANAPASRELNSALAACFAPGAHPPFPDRLVTLTRALLNTPAASVWSLEDSPTQLAGRGGAIEADTLAPLIAELAEPPFVRLAGPVMAARVTCPGGTPAALVVATPAGGPTAQGLAYERLSFLSQLSAASFDSAEAQSLSALISATQAAAQDPAQLQGLVDALALRTGADYAAAGRWDGRAINGVTVSGQANSAKRAALPAALRDRLSDVAQGMASGDTQGFAPDQAGPGGLALLLHEPERQPEALTLTTALWSQQTRDARPQPRSKARLLRWGVGALILMGLGLIPIPDGVSIPSTVDATNRRIITAPFTTLVQQALVKDGTRVAADTPVVQLNTRDLDLELTGLQSDRASAVIEREAARMSGNAAALRNGEIAVERLDARIALLHARKDSATLTAPIAGIIVLGDLTQSVGSTVRQGDPLLEVVDPSRLTLSLTIPDTHLGKLSPGDTGRFRPDFDPTLSAPATVETISPAIDLTTELPTAPATAQFDPAPKGLRPGVRGVFQTSDRYTPVALVFYRNLRDWLMLRLWL